MNSKIKIIKYLWISIGIFIIANSGLSQDTTAFCNLEEFLIDNFFNKNGACGTDLYGDFLFYDNIDTYIPRLDNEPLHNPPLKKIKININIFQKSDGTENFPDNETTRESFRQILIWVNNRFKISDPCDPIPGVLEVDESYINFDMGELGSERIYFYQDDYSWGLSGGSSLRNYMESNYPERLECLNIFISGQQNTTAHASPPSYTNLDANLYTYLGSWYQHPVTTDWVASVTMAHELGHNLQLLHTYYGGGASANCDNNAEYLSDVFGNWPGNCPHVGPPNIWSPDACDNTIPDGDRITNNIMGGNKQNDYLSPKQSGKMHRALALTSVRKYVDEDVYNGDHPLVIVQNELWDFDIKLYRDIIVEPGVELTINCNLTMPWKGKIIVEPGAQLIVDGGTITTDSKNNFWKGIIVEGDTDAHQYEFTGPCAQGKLILKNGAIIENAVIGAFIGSFKSNGAYDYDKAGGIVQVVGNNSLEDPAASFINNQFAVKFLAYQNYYPTESSKRPNRSYFNNTLFEVNGDYHGQSYWYYDFVGLFGVNGINFAGCTFTNSSSNYGTGIYCTPSQGITAGCRVRAICTAQMVPCPEQSLDKCRFENLSKGIYASNTGVNTISIENAIFENNSYGIQMTNVNNASVLFSDFYIGQASDKEQQACGSKASAYGIYMDNCTGFAIEENEFYKASGTPTGNYVGIRIAETNAVDEVYNNYFEGLSFANYTEGKNWSNDQIYQGLAFICNENSNNYRDIDIEPNSYGQGGVQAFQGNTEMPAGNRFSPTGADYHIYNNGNYPVVYYYQQGITGAYPNPVYNVGREAVPHENECLSHYGGGGSGGDNDRLVLNDDEKLIVEQQYVSSLNNYNNVKVLYDNLKDGGNTEDLRTEVVSSWPDDMWELRAELLGKSPHLSLDVLKEAADKTDVLPESVLFEILAANPDELKKEELLKYLEDKENPLPEYMIDILRQLSYGITYKTVLQQQMANYSLVKTRAAHDMIRSILNDTVTNLPALRSWLDNLGGIRADQQIINSYLAEGNYTDALSLTSMMPALYNLEGNNLDEHNYFVELLNLKIGLFQQGRSLSGLASDEQAQLNNIAQNSTGAAGSESRGILESGYGYSFCDCINIEDNQGYKSTVVDPASLSKVYGVTVTVDPNPAKDWTAFTYTLPGSKSKGTIKIVNVTGKVIEIIEVEGQNGQFVWDTRSIPSGVYMYTFIVDGMVSSDKIVIRK